MAYNPTLEDTPNNQVNSGYVPSLGDTPEPENNFDPSFSEKLAPNILAGLAQMGHGVLNTPSNVANYAASKGWINPETARSVPRQADYNFASILKLPSATTADKIVQGLAHYSPAFLMPASELGAAGKAIESIPKVGGYLSRAASLAPGQAAFEATQNDNPVSGAITGATSSLVAPAIESIANVLKPSNLLRGNLSPKELLKNLRVTQGTNTGIGDVIQSPMSKFMLENVLRYIPFSGVNDTFAKVGKQIGFKGEKLVNDYLGNSSPYNISEKITTALKNASEKQRVSKDLLYEDSNKIAEDIGLKLDLPKFSSTAKKYIDSINDSTFLKHEPEAKSLLGKLYNYVSPTKEERVVGNIVDKSGKPLIDDLSVTTPTLKESNILASKLKELSDKHAVSSSIEDRSKATVFSNLAKSLKGDITESIKSSGNKKLQDSFNRAETNYGKNFSPFLDKEIYKFTHGKEDPQNILNAFIKTGSTNDKSNLLSKIMDKLSPEEQDLVRYSYFSRAIKGAEDDRRVDPNALKNIWGDNRLGIEQRRALVPDKKQRRQLDDFIGLVEKNPKAMSLMFNPNTGFANLLPLALKSPIGTLVSKVIGARPLASKMTSEEFRNNLVNAMIENKRIKLPSGSANLIPGITGMETGK